MYIFIRTTNLVSGAAIPEAGYSKNIIDCDAQPLNAGAFPPHLPGSMVMIFV